MRINYKLTFFIIAVFFLFIAFPRIINPIFLGWGKITDQQIFPAFAYAADEPPFTKEGELRFLEKKTNKRIVTIDIEIADNDYERTRGLMYRHSLPDNAGMLFIFEKTGPRSFWMRNTYIPLDVIFVDEKKQIITIYKKTEPLSYNAIPSKKDAKYVVEVNAGFCDKHGIVVGDLMAFERARN
jgi:uncharacterized protein